MSRECNRGRLDVLPLPSCFEGDVDHVPIAFESIVGTTLAEMSCCIDIACSEIFEPDVRNLNRTLSGFELLNDDRSLAGIGY